MNQIKTMSPLQKEEEAVLDMLFNKLRLIPLSQLCFNLMSRGEQINKEISQIICERFRLNPHEFWFDVYPVIRNEKYRIMGAEVTVKLPSRYKLIIAPLNPNGDERENVSWNTYFTS